jgi:hypothetical protein
MSVALLAIHSAVGFTSSIIAAALAASSPAFRSIMVFETDVGIALAGWDLRIPNAAKGAAIEARAIGYAETTFFPATQAGAVADDIQEFLRSDEHEDVAMTSKRLELLRHLLEADSWPSFTLVEAGFPFTAFTGVESGPGGAPKAWPASHDEALRAGFVTRLNTRLIFPYFPRTGLVLNTILFTIFSFAFFNCVASISRRLKERIRSRSGRCPECGYIQTRRGARCSECGESCRPLRSDP